jgi:phosphoglycolate phosphatase-like HAD superfamily hydrolase
VNSQVGAIAFDFDGVLVDSVDIKTNAFAKLYGGYGPSVTERVVEYHLAHGGVSRTEKFRYFHKTFLNRELSTEEESKLAAEFSILVENAVTEAPWVSGARELLESGVLTVPLFVVSGTPEAELRRIVERRGMACYFQALFGAPARKGAILLYIATSLAMSPKRILMVGDAMTDHDGAQEVGAGFVGRLAPGDSSPFPANIPIIHDLRELVDIA